MKLAPLMQLDETGELGRYLVEEIGKYFAAAKHDILILEVSGLSDKFKEDLWAMDLAIHGISDTGDLINIRRLANRCCAVLGNLFWERRTREIQVKMETLRSLPETDRKLHMPMLNQVYRVEFERLMYPMGSKEFATKLGWDKGKFATYRQRGYVPKEMNELAATPIWTTGQVENFRRVLANRNTNRKDSWRDWQTMI